MKETAISVLALLTLFFLEVISANELSLPFHLPINGTFGLEGINNASAGVYLNEGECGMQADGAKCPTGMCCSIWGWCGTTSDYCGSGFCQNQCTGPGPSPHGRCGMQAGGGAPSQKDDADGKLMADYVLMDYVVVLMVGVEPHGIIVLPEFVKVNAHPHHLHPHLHLHLHLRLHITGDCCSIWGWCGPTYEYCSPGYCQMQCTGPYPEGRCGWQADGKSCPTATGQCCSNAGWCGTTSDYCASEHCQSQCNTTLTSPIKNRMRGLMCRRLALGIDFDKMESYNSLMWFHTNQRYYNTTLQNIVDVPKFVILIVLVDVLTAQHVFH
ncbi:hypothetical protein MTR67_015208 [Solanum verrucosum]|uniref:Chitin-binding type-1 domain-containing protein n=1 Tax=Solanum verrucosum TaxID=315347 RepID=A0AAF0QET0_SOLVR|nr:hypothetical protein MTR67_015208 [Solanum verrucosum]